MLIKKLFINVVLPMVLLTAVTTTASANFYLGASWGGYQINESNLDDNDDLLKAFAGFSVNEWFGIEGSWLDFNTINSSTSNFAADGVGLAAVFMLPLSDATSFYAKAGQFWWESDSTLGGVVGNNDGNDTFFGAGFKFGANDAVSVRVEAERYDVDQVDLEAYSIGLQINF